MAVSTTIAGGLFVTLEGPEGAGKTTQIELLSEALTSAGYAVLKTREPGGTPLGEQLRQLLMCRDGAPVAPEAELLLFGASRAQHMRERILPHLEQGGVVLCDRFLDSTTAYQGYARKLDMAFIAAMHDFSVCGRWPNLTFLLDISLEESRRRTRGRDGAAPNDRFEAEDNDFHRLVHAGFHDLARQFPQRFRVIDAERPAAAIAADILAEVRHALD